MEKNYYMGKILSIDENGTEVKDDAFSVDVDDENNYILKVYIADPITNNESLIEQITGLKLDFRDSNNTLSVKSAFRKYSLSEEEEKRCFCFEFKISQTGKLKELNYYKQNIMIDIEMTYDDVAEVISEGGELYEFFSVINELSDILYSKRNSGEVFKTYGYYVNYDFTFPREFNVLVNMILAEHFHANGIPLIYDVEEYDKYKSHMKFWYYTSVPTKSVTEKNPKGYYYGAFTSPLQNFEDLKNLEIFNDFMIKNYSEEEREKLIKIYTSQLRGYKKIKEDSSIDCRRK